MKTIDNQVYDDSDSFEITDNSGQASITITSPSSGTSWKKGTTYTITWTKSGNMNSRVKIRLYQGNTKVLRIADSTANDGSYSWTVPGSLQNGQYRIRVKTIDNQVYDDSDSFEITEASETKL